MREEEVREEEDTGERDQLRNLFQVMGYAPCDMKELLGDAAWGTLRCCAPYLSRRAAPAPPTCPLPVLYRIDRPLA